MGERNMKWILILFFIISGCSRNDLPNVELIQGMMEDPGYKTQEGDSQRPNAITMLLPPEGTVPRGFNPYPYKQKPEIAAVELKNPRSGDFTPAWILKGQKSYEIYCAICHGDMGKGDGPISSKMPWPPPPLVSERIRGLSDGYIFHVISEGFGVMGGYANQLATEDRWAVVNYLKNLQKMSK